MIELVAATYHDDFLACSLLVKHEEKTTFVNLDNFASDYLAKHGKDTRQYWEALTSKQPTQCPEFMRDIANYLQEFWNIEIIYSPLNTNK